MDVGEKSTLEDFIERVEEGDVRDKWVGRFSFQLPWDAVVMIERHSRCDYSLWTDLPDGGVQTLDFELGEGDAK